MIKESLKHSGSIRPIIGLFSILLLSAACSSGYTIFTSERISSLYTPENAKPPLTPDSSVVLANGTTLDLYDLDGVKRRFNPEMIRKYLNPYCNQEITDKKIPVYFTDEMSCPTPSMGCTLTNAAKTQQFAQIRAPYVNSILNSSPGTAAIYCKDMDIIGYSDSRNLAKEANCQEPVFETNPLTVENAIAIHEVGIHICQKSTDEKLASKEAREYIINVNQNSDQNHQMIEEIK